MTFTDDNTSRYFIKSNKWRNELNRIIEDPNARDPERLFLVCFMKDKLNWDEFGVVQYLQEFAQWENLDFKITTRQVNIIFEKKNNGRLSGSKTKGSKFYGSQISDETQTKETQRRKNDFSKTDETVAVATERKVEKMLYRSEFLVSSTKTRRREQNKKEVNSEMAKGNRSSRPKELKIFSQANNDDKWIKTTKKEGDYGIFYSLDSGPMIKVTLTNGNEGVGFGWAKNYIGLPEDVDMLRSIIDGINGVIDDMGTTSSNEPEPDKPVGPKDKNKKL